MKNERKTRIVPLQVFRKTRRNDACTRFSDRRNSLSLIYIHRKKITTTTDQVSLFYIHRKKTQQQQQTKFRVEIYIVRFRWGTYENARARLIFKIQTPTPNFKQSFENVDIHQVIFQETAESTTSRRTDSVSYTISSKRWRGDCNRNFTSTSWILLQSLSLQCRYRDRVEIEHFGQMGTSISLERSKICTLASQTSGTSGIWRNHCKDSFFFFQNHV